MRCSDAACLRVWLVAIQANGVIRMQQRMGLFRSGTTFSALFSAFGRRRFAAGHKACVSAARMAVSGTICALFSVFLAGSAFSDNTILLLYGGGDTTPRPGYVIPQGVPSLDAWGSGGAQEVTTPAFFGHSSLKVSTDGYYTGARIDLPDPIDLSRFVEDPSKAFLSIRVVPGKGKTPTAAGGEGQGRRGGGGTGRARFFGRGPSAFQSGGYGTAGTSTAGQGLSFGPTTQPGTGVTFPGMPAGTVSNTNVSGVTALSPTSRFLQTVAERRGAVTGQTASRLYQQRMAAGAAASGGLEFGPGGAVSTYRATGGQPYSFGPGGNYPAGVQQPAGMGMAAGAMGEEQAMPMAPGMGMAAGAMGEEEQAMPMAPSMGMGMAAGAMGEEEQAMPMAPGGFGPGGGVPGVPGARQPTEEAQPAAPPGPPGAVRVVLVTDKGQLATSGLRFESGVVESGNWTRIDVPLSELEGEKSALQGQVKRVIVTGNSPGDLYVGEISVVVEENPLDFDVELNLGPGGVARVGDILTGQAKIRGGLRPYEVWVVWDFDDRDGIQGDQARQNVRFIYSAPGRYVVTVTATDIAGRRGWVRKQIPVVVEAK